MKTNTATRMGSVLLCSTLLAGAVAVAPLAAQAEEVTIGILVPLTGELGEFGKIVAGGVELGVAEVNMPLAARNAVPSVRSWPIPAATPRSRSAKRPR